MSNLSKLIDDMSKPAISNFFNETDRQILLLVIDMSKQFARPYNGDFKAPWLLSDFEATEWVTTNRNREEVVDGAWRNSINVDWAMRLPNGSFLTDPKYRKLLDLNKRIAFLIRSGHVSEVTAPVTWKAIVSVLLQLTRWVVLHESQFRPEEFGFKLLDQFAIDSLLRLHAEGGWAAAQQIPQRLLSRFHKGAYKKPCPQHLFECIYVLPSDAITRITAWLVKNSYYGVVESGANVNKAYLLRERLANDIYESVDSMRVSWKLSAFCRQFEPDFQVGGLLVNIHQKTEFPDQKTKTIQDVVNMGAAEKTLDWISSVTTTILSAHRHIPNLLPEPTSISVRRAHTQALTLTRQSGHSPFIPIDVGLAYFNHAMRFVHVYGDTLVDFYLAVIASAPKSFGSAACNASLSEMCSGPFGRRFTVQIDGDIVPIGGVLGISQFVRSEINYDLLRNQPTLDEALRVLVGACVVCIALMKPSRENELTHLKRDCLRHRSDGYHLKFTLGKSNSGESYQDITRPIPVITAKAIQLLQKLGQGLVDLFDDTRKISGNLFYLPKQREWGALVANTSLLYSHLDVFCDYVGLLPDDLGRRWYLRIHEMRKWFLLLLFWSGKYDVLDAARWIAGHIDASHIYAYIEREFPGEELPKLEAEYAVDRLRALESAGADSARRESGLDALYETVLQHFKVQSLSLVPESEWTDYVVALRQAEGFSLEPHSVSAAGKNKEVVGINVSFVLREKRYE
ncbi:hypothetical protein [Paraburkholderia nemoris]|uniref:Integrase n=1 Tax=Paraburkholderia nemoris TaxID=2793076 RepID=A0ABM8RH38_9BURK|nr:MULTISPECIES: hypothetical protein [Paraburkholderia]MBK3812827.1 hypothetical protein [Paraburkholderia aspalathi]CAE6752880.1 hypothetical protein R69776_03009 [Paraburkholderia nemoris]CAE6830324.1 hypothetical protein R75777_06569 [Paraburkholderia nemoris]